MSLLEIKNLNKSFGKNKVLKDINLSIEKGSTLGIIGPTGCGKTTLLRIINLLDSPSSGEILFNGVDITSIKNAMNYRRKMAMVFQKPIVFRGSVLDNIYYGLKVRGVSKESSVDRIKELLDSLNLSGYEDRDASTLSGGETQRIALARALITEPDLLLLDEPTANLDPSSTEQIESIVEDLNKTKDLTTIIATHNLIQGQRLSDEIALLNHKIYQIGKPEEIFKKPKSKFVADFIGMKNVIKGEVIAHTPDNLSVINLNGIKIYSTSRLDGDVFVSIKPEDITVSREKVGLISALNELNGNVKEIKETVNLIQMAVEIKNSELIFTVHLTKKSVINLNITIGTSVFLQFKAAAVHVFKSS